MMRTLRPEVLYVEPAASLYTMRRALIHHQPRCLILSGHTSPNGEHFCMETPDGRYDQKATLDILVTLLRTLTPGGAASADAVETLEAHLEEQQSAALELQHCSRAWMERAAAERAIDHGTLPRRRSTLQIGPLHLEVPLAAALGGPSRLAPAPSLALGQLQCVFLNSCSSLSIGTAIVRSLPSVAVICWSTLTEDSAARAFLVGFLQKLAEAAEGHPLLSWAMPPSWARPLSSPGGGRQGIPWRRSRPPLTPAVPPSPGAASALETLTRSFILRAMSTGGARNGNAVTACLLCRAVWCCCMPRGTAAVGSSRSTGERTFEETATRGNAGGAGSSPECGLRSVPHGTLRTKWCAICTRSCPTPPMIVHTPSGVRAPRAQPCRARRRALLRQRTFSIRRLGPHRSMRSQGRFDGRTSWTLRRPRAKRVQRIRSRGSQAVPWCMRPRHCQRCSMQALGPENLTR